ncbi:hypothetical protein AWB96_04670 [Mycobacteroides chelonae]|nr:hypothetical protein GR01_00570 [Mycobacteroides chelonae]ANB00770.1 hypothetical protein BB28_00585 [Mycobacteroides chelonae CCUG 47445]OLT81464.1 hypothetical protein BKG56_04380 [Mycobacteroides chelonae]ORV17498.1 hypothetical protein AWB96_04670 [Mycobacteroides chelonae]
MKPFGAASDPSEPDSRRLSPSFVASRRGGSARRGEVPDVMETVLAHTPPAGEPHHVPVDRWWLGRVTAACAVEAPGLSARNEEMVARKRKELAWVVAGSASSFAPFLHTAADSRSR